MKDCWKSNDRIGRINREEIWKKDWKIGCYRNREDEKRENTLVDKRKTEDACNFVTCFVASQGKFSTGLGDQKCRQLSPLRRVSSITNLFPSWWPFTKITVLFCGLKVRIQEKEELNNCVLRFYAWVVVLAQEKKEISRSTIAETEYSDTCTHSNYYGERWLSRAS